MRVIFAITISISIGFAIGMYTPVLAVVLPSADPYAHWNTIALFEGFVTSIDHNNETIQVALSDTTATAAWSDHEIAFSYDKNTRWLHTHSAYSGDTVLAGLVPTETSPDALKPGDYISFVRSTATPHDMYANTIIIRDFL